jgi:Asp-tRNA(Asn)/Glu-tRNA(Gln) amidotransferase A subunit family amidase
MAAPYTDRWTVVANLTGLTSLSVPAGRSGEDGMPGGIMMSAVAGADGELLGLGAVLERSGPGARTSVHRGKCGA